MSQFLDRLTFFEGIPAILEQLRQKGFTLHILSSNSEENIREFLTAQGITSVETVTSARNVFGKNRAISKFLRQHGLSPADILYVGDEERDIVACKDVKVRIAAVTWGLDSEDILRAAGADVIVNRPQDLLGIVESVTVR